MICNSENDSLIHPRPSLSLDLFIVLLFQQICALDHEFQGFVSYVDLKRQEKKKNQANANKITFPNGPIIKQDYIYISCYKKKTTLDSKTTELVYEQPFHFLHFLIICSLALCGLKIQNEKHRLIRKHRITSSTTALLNSGLVRMCRFSFYKWIRHVTEQRKM